MAAPDASSLAGGAARPVRPAVSAPAAATAAAGAASGGRGLLRLVRTNAFRLAAIYLVLFAGSVLTLLFFIYWSTAGFVERQTEATLDAEVAGLAEQYQQRGLSGLVQIIAERSAGERGDAMIYLIADPDGRPLAGNLASWPEAATIRPGLVRFDVEIRGPGGRVVETGEARGAVFLIPGGFRLLVGRDLRDAAAFRVRVTETLGWAGLLTLALGLVGGVLMSRHMLRRVEAVSETAARIIAGDLTQRVPLAGTGDEFDQLAANLNAMLDQIARLMAALREVTDNIAHDLRTPLARLRARLEVVLIDQQADAARYEEAIRETIAEADRLLATFTALLRIAEAESGASRAGMAPLDLAALARAVAELYEPAAEEKGLVLAVEAPTAPAMVRGDGHLLSQAAANLLDNALKYAPEGRIAVAVEADAERGEARLSVADEGPGIPPDRRDSVFDRFVRLETSRSTPGNGLGLSLVRAVATLHGGAVRLEDNAPRGLTAVLVLPLLPPAAAAADGPAMERRFENTGA
jgi:signal transduction histidine kinase